MSDCFLNLRVWKYHLQIGFWKFRFSRNPWWETHEPKPFIEFM
jgi:hypothetical protein